MVLKLNKENKCSMYMSIAIADKKLFHVYCCRAYNSAENRVPYDFVKNHIDEYLKSTIGTDFIVKEVFPIGYCIKTQEKNICSDKIEVSKLRGISLGTLTKCNYKCPNCTIRSDKKSGLTEEEEIDLTSEIILGLKKYKNIDNLQISNRGEISSYKNIDKIVEAIIKNENIKFVNILTNGSNCENLQKIINLLNEKNIKVEVNLSFYSLNEKIYKKLTNQDKLKYVLYTIDNLSNCDITICYLLFKENINEFENILNFVKEKNKKIYIAPNMYDEDMHKKLIELKKKYNDEKIIFEGSEAKI